MNKHFAATSALLLAGILLPIVTFAASSFPYWGPLVSCTGYATAGKPACTSICNLLETIQNVIFFFMTLAVLVVAPVLLAWGGIMIMIAGGSPERMSQGRKIISGVVIGIVLALGAFLIVNTVMKIGVIING
jgi:hypothetical protein